MWLGQYRTKTHAEKRAEENACEYSRADRDRAQISPYQSAWAAVSERRFPYRRTHARFSALNTGRNRALIRY